ncbi:phosphatidate cytidylyltransferase [Candidatus Woesearchaeota archaeon]|nr:phosphatidate cytidylyltransferase [Candidatus Woesearchaeota archaeon]
MNITVCNKYKPDFCVAYGSGAIKQGGYPSSDRPMIDFIFGVDNSLKWHQENMQNNANDYSIISRLFGPRFVEKIQSAGAGMYYNPFIKVENQQIKYGVISVDTLVSDLTDWNSIYVAGRLHKPVLTIRTTPTIDKAIEKNRLSAINVALMMLPQDFSEDQLYMKIAGISYTGDSRMGIGENPMKVKNIVTKNMAEFFNMYFHLLDESTASFSNGWIQQDKDPNVIQKRYNFLPVGLRHHMNRIIDISNQDDVNRSIQSGLVRIIKSTSIAQTLKGVISAGVIKSIDYGYAKLKKARS